MNLSIVDWQIYAWPRWGLLLLALGFVLLVTVLVLRSLAAWQLRRLKVEIGIEVRNLGNARSAYELTLQDSTDLRFAFVAPDGTPLAEREYQEHIEGPAPATRPAKRAKIGRSLGGAVGDVGGRGLSIVSSLANVFYALATILPASVSNVFSAGGSTMVDATFKADKMVQVQQETGRLQGAATGTTYYRDPWLDPNTPHPGEAPSTVTATISRIWAETPLVAPGEALAVALVLSPLRAIPGGRRAITVISRVAGLPGAEPVASEGGIEMADKSWLRRVGPGLGVVLIATSVLALACWLIFVYVPVSR
jgi:hypothetical protein